MNPLADRYTQMAADRQRDALGRSPALRQETVARHYLKLASLAADMDVLIRHRRFGYTQPADYSRAPEPDVDALIDRLEATIASQHVADFGMPPAWQEQPAARPETEERA